MTRETLCTLMLVTGVVVDSCTPVNRLRARDFPPPLRAPSWREKGRLAVKWDGKESTTASVWVDFDGDRQWSPDELVADGMLISPGIEVIELDVPPGVIATTRPRLRIERGSSEGQTVPRAERRSCQREPGVYCEWSSGFHLPGILGSIEALAVYDDGHGEALYIAGEFTEAGAVTVNQVVRWDGTQWSPLTGPSGTGVTGTVYASAVYDDGSGEALYAGGWFESAGGVAANRIAKWDGAEWSALAGPSGVGVTGVVYSLAVYDDGSGEALYAGGMFASAGGVWANSIARWDGNRVVCSRWSLGYWRGHLGLCIGGV